MSILVERRPLCRKRRQFTLQLPLDLGPYCSTYCSIDCSIDCRMDEAHGALPAGRQRARPLPYLDHFPIMYLFNEAMKRL